MVDSNYGKAIPIAIYRMQHSFGVFFKVNSIEFKYLNVDHEIRTKLSTVLDPPC